MNGVAISIVVSVREKWFWFELVAHGFSKPVAWGNGKVANI